MDALCKGEFIAFTRLRDLEDGVRWEADAFGDGLECELQSIKDEASVLASMRLERRALKVWADLPTNSVRWIHEI